jgi:Ser/Thr protein kinase RdoA (MazF antagonist)
MVSEEEAIEVLKAWGIVPTGPLREIHEGSVFRVSTERGEEMILKDLGSGHSRERLAFEHEVLSHLSDANVPVALPLSDLRGCTSVSYKGRLFTLSPSLMTTDEKRTVPWIELCSNYGRTIAELHLALASFPADEIAVRTWRNIPVIEVFDQHLPSLKRLLPEEESVGIVEIFEGIELSMRRSLADLPEQLIHRDCHPGNILIENREVVGFVDCDHFSIGSPVLDIGYFLIHLIKWNTEDTTKTDEWLECIPVFLQGYEEKRHLHRREREALPYMMVYVLVMFAELFCNASNWAAAKVERTALAYVCSNIAEIRLRALWP